MSKLDFRHFDKFFDVNGYTSTSANYIANKAKEMISAVGMNNISFLNEDVKSLNSAVNASISRGLTEDDVNKFKENLERITNLNALISWLREAIKAKETQLNEVENTSFNTWMQVFHDDVDRNTYGAELLESNEPVKPDFSESNYVMNNMSVKDANEYLYLLSACSTFGQFIHPDGKFNRARQHAYDKSGTSRVVDNNATTLVYDYTMSVDGETIENTFFDLQETHREYQKRLNSIKYNIDNAIQKMRDDYTKECDEYDRICRENELRVNAARTSYRNMFNEWKINTLNELRQKKIVIPNALKEIVDYVNNVSK